MGGGRKGRKGNGRAKLIGQNLHNYLTLARSRDVNGHVSDVNVTIPLNIGHFLLVVLRNQASMVSYFEYIGH